MRHLPNLARWNLHFRSGRVVKHSGCGSLGVIQSGESGPLTCFKCGKKVGRLATQDLREKAVAEVSMGRQGELCQRYRWPQAKKGIGYYNPPPDAPAPLGALGTTPEAPPPPAPAPAPAPLDSADLPSPPSVPSEILITLAKALPKNIKFDMAALERNFAQAIAEDPIEDEESF